MSRLLVIYATTHGHTAKIAQRIAEGLRARGGEVDLRTAAAAPSDLHGYDAVVAGGSIHKGAHQRELVRWLSHHAITLNRMPSAVFSVSLSASEDSDEARAAVANLIDELCEQTGWFPRTRVAIAGALQYREYDHFTRLMMRLLMARGGHPTDITEDVDYTDWDAVDAFAEGVAQLAARETSA